MSNKASLPADSAGLFIQLQAHIDNGIGADRVSILVGGGEESLSNSQHAGLIFLTVTSVTVPSFSINARMVQSPS